MNAWIYSSGKVVKVTGGAKLAHKEATDLVLVQRQNDEVLAVVRVGGDTFIILSEDQPESGAASGPRIGEGPFVG